MRRMGTAQFGFRPATTPDFAEAPCPPVQAAAGAIARSVLEELGTHEDVCAQLCLEAAGFSRHIAAAVSSSAPVNQRTHPSMSTRRVAEAWNVPEAHPLVNAHLPVVSRHQRALPSVASFSRKCAPLGRVGKSATDGVGCRGTHCTRKVGVWSPQLRAMAHSCGAELVRWRADMQGTYRLRS
jgi:hypothetical protein